MDICSFFPNQSRIVYCNIFQKPLKTFPKFIFVVSSDCLFFNFAIFYSSLFYDFVKNPYFSESYFLGQVNIPKKYLWFALNLIKPNYRSKLRIFACLSYCHFCLLDLKFCLLKIKFYSKFQIHIFIRTVLLNDYLYLEY